MEKKIKYMKEGQQPLQWLHLLFSRLNLLFPSIILFSTLSHSFQCYRLAILLSKRESYCWLLEPLDSIRMKIRGASLFTFSICMSVCLWVVLCNLWPSKPPTSTCSYMVCLVTILLYYVLNKRGDSE